MARKSTEKSREAAQAIIRGAREPRIDPQAYVRTMVEYLNYHNAHTDAKDKRKWLYASLLRQGKDDFVEVLHDATDFEIGQLGVLCRAKDSGENLQAKHLNYIDRTIAKLVLKYANVEDDEEEEDKPEAPKIDRNELIASAFYGEVVQGAIDEYVERVRYDLKFVPLCMKKVLVADNINAAQAELVADKMAPFLTELLEVLQGKDPDLKEGYGKWSKPQLKAFAAWVSEMVQECLSRADAIKATRKPRVVKNKPKKIATAKLKYQLSCAELNLRSIDPASILQATELFAYRVEARRLIYFKAQEGKKFDVTGQTLLNVDETLSGSKTVRKPDMFFKGLNMAKKALMQAYENLTTTEGDAPVRIMGDMILLKAF
jgi:hypothetical protein